MERETRFFSKVLLVLTSEVFHLVVSGRVAEILPQLATSHGAAVAVAPARVVLKREVVTITPEFPWKTLTILLLFSSSPTVLGALRLNFVGVSP